MGDALRSGAEASVGRICRDVTVGAPGASSGEDIVVTPRVATVLTSPNPFHLGTGGNELVTTVSIEWTIRDAARNLLWVGTIDGEGRGETGWGPIKRGMMRLRAAMRQAFRNASVKIRDSPEIQRRFRPQQQPAENP
jgi:hypothetical protein